VVQDSLYARVKSVRRQVKSLKSVIIVGQRSENDDPLFLDLIRQSSPKHPPQVPLSWNGDLVALPYSSGTTGLPKGVMLTHQNLVANASQFISSGRITDRDTLLLFLPFYHIYGIMLINGALYSGATQVIMEAFDLDLSLSLAQKHQATLYYAVPPILIQLDVHPHLSAYDLSHLRYIMVGAAPMAPDVAQRVQEKLGVRVLQGYGLTEASPVTHLNPVDQGQVKLDSVGVGVSNQEQKIVDLETGERELEVGEVGELVVKGPHVMQGYWKAQEETARVLRGGWLSTGDIARMDAEGYVYIVDRKKEMIKYKGFSVAPAEVEAVLFQHEAVADCAVIGKPDVEAGEIPKALVLLRSGQEISPDDLMEFVGSRIAGYKRVREVEFVTSIPKTATGKILRRVLIEAERSVAQEVVIEEKLTEERVEIVDEIASEPVTDPASEPVEESSAEGSDGVESAESQAPDEAVSEIADAVVSQASDEVASEMSDEAADDTADDTSDETASESERATP
jgi:long-chain acyl-CoA synthetase